MTLIASRRALIACIMATLVVAPVGAAAGPLAVDEFEDLLLELQLISVEVCAEQAITQGAVPEATWMVTYTVPKGRKGPRTAAATASGTFPEFDSCLDSAAKSNLQQYGADKKAAEEFTFPTRLSISGVSCEGDGNAYADVVVGPRARRRKLGACPAALLEATCAPAKAAVEGRIDAGDWAGALAALPPACSEDAKRIRERAWTSLTTAAEAGDVSAATSIAEFLVVPVATRFVVLEWPPPPSYDKYAPKRSSGYTRPPKPFVEAVDALVSANASRCFMRGYREMSRPEWTSYGGLELKLEPNADRTKWWISADTIGSAAALGPEGCLAGSLRTSIESTWDVGAEVPTVVHVELADKTFPNDPELAAIGLVEVARASATLGKGDYLRARATFDATASFARAHGWSQIEEIARAKVTALEGDPAYHAAQDAKLEEDARKKVEEEARARAERAFYADTGFEARFGEPVGTLLMEKVACELIPGASCPNLRDFSTRWCTASWTKTVAVAGADIAGDVLSDYCESSFNGTGAWGVGTATTAFTITPEVCVERIRGWCP